MSSYNRTILMGHLTRDPEIKTLQNNQSVGNFGIAVNEIWKDKEGNKKESVSFIDIEVWGRTAELVGQYCSKGKAVLIEGKLKMDSWEDKDGNKRTKLKVVAEGVQFLGSGNKEHADPLPSESAAKKTTRSVPSPVQEEDNVPF